MGTENDTGPLNWRDLWMRPRFFLPLGSGGQAC